MTTDTFDSTDGQTQYLDENGKTVGDAEPPAAAQRFPQPADGYVYRGEDGPTHVIEPTSGEIVPLEQTSAGDLAAYIYSMREVKALADEAIAAVTSVLLHRMDRSASWTIREDGWELAGESPKTVVRVDAKLLFAKLHELVEADVIDENAAKRAVKVESKYTAMKGGLNALAKLELPEINEAIDECSERLEDKTRYLTIKPTHAR